MTKLTYLFAHLLAKLENLKEEAGQGLIEYALIAALISIVAIAAMQIVGTDVTAVFTSIGNALTGA